MTRRATFLRNLIKAHTYSHPTTISTLIGYVDHAELKNGCLSGAVCVVQGLPVGEVAPASCRGTAGASFSASYGDFGGSEGTELVSESVTY